MIHKKVEHRPTIVKSINMQNGAEISNLELFFLLCQDLIQSKIKDGKKGKKLASGYKMSYKKAQGVLFDLHSYFAVKGCFSFGPCETCGKFGNAISSTGIIGQCRGQEKLWCDACSEHTIEGGGFGL